MIKFFVQRPLVVWILTCTILGAGFYCMRELPVEVMPEFTTNEVWVTATYPGASPEEMERLVANPLEKRLDDVKDVEFIQSTSTEGSSHIIVKFEDYVDDMKDATRAVRDAVDETTDLPDEIDRPQVVEIDTEELPMVMVALSANLPENDLRRLTIDLADRIEDLPGIASAKTIGTRDLEYRIAVDMVQLKAYHLSLNDITAAVRRRHFNLPAGTLTQSEKEYLIHVRGEPHNIDDLTSVVVRTVDEQPIYLGDVARIEQGFADQRYIVRLNGVPSTTIRVQKRNGSNALQTMKKLEALIMQTRARTPPGVKIEVVADSTQYIRRRVGELVQNGLIGFLLVICVLLLTFSPRRALFVALGIPASFCIAFIYMYFAGISNNVITVFAFVVVLGMIVDDAVIMTENITRWQEEGSAPRRSAILGVREVIKPVLFSHATSIIAFLALLAVTGVPGKFVRFIPIMISVALIASLIEATTCLPSHIADLCPPPHPTNSPDWRSRLVHYLQERYEIALRWCLNHRLLCLSIPFIGLSITMVLIKTGAIPLVLFPHEEPDQLFINFSLTRGTHLDETNRVMRHIEYRIQKGEFDDIAHVAAIAGGDLQWFAPVSKHTGHLTLELVDRRDRELDTDELMEQLRTLLAEIPGPKEVKVTFPQWGPPTGKPVNVRISGEDWNVLRHIGNQIQTKLHSFQDKSTGKALIHNIDDDRSVGNPQVHIAIDETKAKLSGVDFHMIAETVRTAFAGRKASVRREGDDSIDIVVRASHEDSDGIKTLRNMTIYSVAGEPVPLRSIAQITERAGYSSVVHYNGQNALTVQADIDHRLTESSQVKRHLQPFLNKLRSQYSDYQIEFGGEQETQLQSFKDLGIAFTLAGAGIFILLVIAFNSFGQAMLIMLSIPLAGFGAAVWLLLTRNPVSFIALIGATALAGIVVNDAIILIDFVNKYRSKYPTVGQALIAAGRVRMRPVMLTSLTTILGLLPSAIGIPVKSPLWSPLANTIAWGLAIATFGTLLLIPAAYSLIADVSRWTREQLHKIAPHSHSIAGRDDDLSDL